MADIDHTLLASLDEIELRRIADNPLHSLFYKANEEMWRRVGFDAARDEELAANIP